MKKRILAILLAIALLSSFSAIAFAETVTYAGSADGKTCTKCNNFTVPSATATSTISQDDADAKAKEIVDKAYAEHYNSCIGNKVKCPTCGQICENETALETHINKMHPTVDYVCYDCKPAKHFETAEALANHYDQYHKEDTNALHCPKCNYIAFSITDYNNHLASNHQGDGEQVTPRDNMQRFFDKYFMGIGLNVNENSFSSVVRIFAYVTEVFMSVFTDSGASEVFQFAGDSGVTYFFETIVPHFWALFTE